MTQAEGTSEDPANNPENFALSDDQWSFMYRHYPEYCTAPYAMMTWLFGQAQAAEEQEKALYGKPGMGGIRTQNEEDELEKIFEDPGQGGVGGKPKVQKSKDDEKRAATLAAEQKKKKIAEIQSKKVAPVKTDAQREEERLIKAFRDKEVVINKDELKEVDPKREPCSMVFIGHVDAGKSTICGNLMLLNDIIDQRTVQKYKEEAKEKGRDSWWLAYVMDVSDEEKAKGKTVEVGRAQFDTPTKKYTIFDAPGHKNYVPNMIMGAALADVAGLVISARKGEFESGFEKDGQTREHAQLAKSLGVQKLIVIVNKMDECHWSKNRFDEIQSGLTPFLNATGYADEDIMWVPIAGLQGHNIKDETPKGTCNWYKGATLM